MQTGSTTGVAVWATPTTNDVFAAPADVHVTVVEPRANSVPDAGVQLTVPVGVTVGLVKVTNSPVAEVVATEMSAWDAITGVTGGAVCATPTTNVVLAAPVEEQVTVVEPMANSVPEAGAQVTVPVGVTVGLV